MGDEAGDALGLRHGSGRGEGWRRSLWTAAGAGAGGRRDAGHEFVAGIGCRDARLDDRVLQGAAARRRTRRRVAASAVGDDQEQRSAPSVLLGELHPVGRMGESRRQTVSISITRVGKISVVMTPTGLHKSLTCADTRDYRKCPDISLEMEFWSVWWSGDGCLRHNQTIYDPSKKVLCGVRWPKLAGRRSALGCPLHIVCHLRRLIDYSIG